MNELEKLTALCVQLGADQTQAVTMAAQLLKRATQLAEQRQIDRTAALGYLIELVLKGRNGEPPPEFPPTHSAAPERG